MISQGKCNNTQILFQYLSISIFAYLAHSNLLTILKFRHYYYFHITDDRKKSVSLATMLCCLSGRGSRVIITMRFIVHTGLLIIIPGSSIDLSQSNIWPPLTKWIAIQNDILYILLIDHILGDLSVKNTSLSFWLTSLCMTLSRLVHISINDPILFFFMAE